MKKTLCLALDLSLLVGIAVPSNAQEFKVIGLRQLGMGGAGIAATEGGLTQYWNPGSLAFQKRFDLEVPASVGVEATGNILDKASQIQNIANQIQSIQSLQTNGTNNGIPSLTQVQNFYTAVNKITALNQDGSGALINAEGGANAHIGRFAFSVNNFTEVGATPFIDTRFNLSSLGNGLPGVNVPGESLNDTSLQTTATNLSGVISNLQQNFGVTFAGGSNATTAANYLINHAQANGATNAQITDAVNQAVSQQAQLQASGVLNGGAGAFGNNQSNVTLRGASLTEYSVGYGYPIPIPERFGQLGLGTNLKLIQGRVGYEQVNILTGSSVSGNSLLSNFTNNSRTTTKPAIDLGAEYKTPLPGHIQFGILGRNLNSPSFDQPDAGVVNGEPSYKDKMQARAGVSARPFSLLTLASDLDLTNNATAVSGYNSRMWGAGAELNLWLLKLRAGLMKNLTGEEPLLYTAGVGLRLFMLSLDIGGALSSKTVTVSDGSKTPAAVQFGAQLSLLFGR